MLWSAESPSLYILSLALINAKGECLQAEACQVLIYDILSARHFLRFAAALPLPALVDAIRVRAGGCCACGMAYLGWAWELA